MDLLQVREKQIFETLKKLQGFRFVIIGGYAVNAYTLPRFSVDCDIVIEDKVELNRIEKALLEFGYKKKSLPKTDNFARYEKRLAEYFVVSFDVLIGAVFDRQTKVSVSADWVFKNSEIRSLKGKTIVEELKVRIINIDALFVMKMISCRSTDIRDIFMIAMYIKDKLWIKAEISSRCDFDNRFRKVEQKITSKQFRNGLQGVYGLIDNQTFEKSINAIITLGNAT